MSFNLQLVVAMCANRGIGINGKLPWRLKGDMEFFKALTTSVDEGRNENAVLMGRKTWESIPRRFRPLPNRINVILSRTLPSAPNGVLLARSMADALRMLADVQPNCVYVIGGSAVYAEALDSPLCNRVYLTRVKAEFTCDTFLPELGKDFVKVKDGTVAMVPSDEKEENGIRYCIEVYDR